MEDRRKKGRKEKMDQNKERSEFIARKEGGREGGNVCVCEDLYTSLPSASLHWFRGC